MLTPYLRHKVVGETDLDPFLLSLRRRSSKYFVKPSNTNELLMTKLASPVLLEQILQPMEPIIDTPNSQLVNGQPGSSTTAAAERTAMLGNIMLSGASQ